ncbi:MAG: methylmalonyl-CoA mutase [Deltaproteobacteria bacterium RIFOXYA12_FULL_61_11]|nr:MAG: methylmalonyl-CoA mutase [Deltaproteobacteria bacterium RIFOXYA12_FULL_61_11]
MNARKGRPIRVLIAKVGLDGHDRGAKFLARALMEQGFEVIYSGLRRTAAQVAAMALQEDVDVIGLSSLSGAHEQTFPAVLTELRNLGLGDRMVLGGGIIPATDAEKLRGQGFAEIFTPGSSAVAIGAFIREKLGA